MSAAKLYFTERSHLELTRSDAAEAYVWKEETRVQGTQFEIGTKAFKRNSETDWEAVRGQAKEGKLNDLPADIYVRCYN